MAIRIIVDSASDYTKEEAEQAGFLFAPMGISFGEKGYWDGVNLTKEEFYHELVDEGGYPVTSQPSPKLLMDLFQSVVDAGDTAIMITMARALSGTFQTAAMIAEDYAGKIAVINSGTVSIGERMIIREAVKIAETAASLEEAADALRERVRHLYLFGYLDQLEYLKRGGRISPAMNFLANLFSVKPIIHVCHDGLDLCKKARGKQKAWKELATLVEEMPGLEKDHLMYGYTGTSDAYVYEFMKQNTTLPASPADRIQIGSTIGTHAGPGCLAIAFFADPTDMMSEDKQG